MLVGAIPGKVVVVAAAVVVAAGVVVAAVTTAVVAAAAPGPPTDGTVVGATVDRGTDDAAPVVVGAIDVVEPCGASVVGGAMARDALQPAATVADTAPIASRGERTPTDPDHRPIMAGGSPGRLSPDS